MCKCTTGWALHTLTGLRQRSTQRRRYLFIQNRSGTTLQQTSVQQSQFRTLPRKLYIGVALAAASQYYELTPRQDLCVTFLLKNHTQKKFDVQFAYTNFQVKPRSSSAF